MYLIDEELQDEGGDAAINSNEEVYGSQNHVSCARNSEHKGCWIHQRGDGPSGRKDTLREFKKNDAEYLVKSVKPQACSGTDP